MKIWYQSYFNVKNNQKFDICRNKIVYWLGEVAQTARAKK